jgi:hypothetical protein
MGWRYILVNHTRKVIEEASLNDIWDLMSYLIREREWQEKDDVEMMYEENRWDEIGRLVVKEGYASHYHPRSFDYT